MNYLSYPLSYFSTVNLVRRFRSPKRTNQLLLMKFA